MQQVSATIIRVLSSRQFFYGVIVFLVLEALWIVFSAAYPLPFDEEFHYGLVQLYGQHWLPWVSDQPPGPAVLDAVTRDVSVLYYYVMSFPYRLFHLFTDNQAALVILLRLINVGLFVWGVALFRKVLLRAKLSPALTNTALAVFVLIPIVPQLAAHINYDNVELLLVAWLCLLVADTVDGFKKRQLAVRSLCLMLLVCAVIGLVKFKALPLVLGAVIFELFYIYRTFGLSWQQWLRAVRKGWQPLSQRFKIGFLVGFILLFGLVIQRYGVNLVEYQSLKPQCDVVLGEERCMGYGPWARNHLLEDVVGDVAERPIAFTATWLYSLHYRLFFAISGVTNNYQNFLPTPLPSAAFVVIVVSGLVALALYWRRVFKGNMLLVFFAVLTAVYVATLWIDNYSQYLQTGQPVAINGRYLLLVMLPFVAIAGHALSRALKPWPALKAGAATLAILLFLQGGGVFSFILRSGPGWFWPNQTVTAINDQARRALEVVILEGPKSY